MVVAAVGAPRYGVGGVGGGCWCAATVGAYGVARTVPARGVPPAPTSRRSCSACAAGSRSAGSLRSSPSITGASGPARSGGGSSSSTIARSVLSGVSWRNGELPSTAAYSSTPSDHRSDSGPGVRPSARSGARNSGEPITSPVIVRAELPSTMAIPKSVSTTRPSLASSTLAGFTSRCSTPASCAARSADSTSAPMCAARCGGNGPSASRSSASEMPRTSSITIHGRPSCVATSYTVTTLWFATRAAAHASRSRRAYIRSTSLAGRPCGARTSFTATSRFSTSSRARQTVPMPPSPSGDRRR